MLSLVDFINTYLFILRPIYWIGAILTMVFIVRKTGWKNIGGSLLCGLGWFLFWIALGIIYVGRRFERA